MDPKISATLLRPLAIAMALGLGLGLALSNPLAKGASPDPTPTYHVVTVELGLGRIKVGDKNISTRAKTIDEAITEFAKNNNSRLVDVYTLGNFGPFFVFEEPSR